MFNKHPDHLTIIKITGKKRKIIHEIKRKAFGDISSNQITVSCLFNLEEVASVTYQLNGLEQGIVVDQNMFTSEIGEILIRTKIFHVKNAVLVLNSKAINYELKQISFSFDKPTIIDHSFNQQIVQICKNGAKINRCKC